MSTTTSTQASGLLDVLLPAFRAQTGIQVKVIAKGTGAAIRDGIDGNVDVIFVHALAREEKFVADGYGTRRYGVMHNDFVVLGPKEDPAEIMGCASAEEAFAKISRSESLFASRGDDSGTHTKEQEIWQATGVALETSESTVVKNGKETVVSARRPKGEWYRSLGQGMGKTLTFAEEKKAYVLSDRGTFLNFKYGKTPALDLEVLCEGDKVLHNPYGVIPVNPKQHPHVRAALAQKFATWITSESAQKLIADYKLLGKPLFYPDAVDK